jgi:hypothetical protein
MDDNKKIVPPSRPTNFGVGKLTGNIQNRPMTVAEKKSETPNKTITNQEKIIKQQTPPKNKKKRVIVAILAVLIILIMLCVILYVAFISPTQPAEIKISFSTSITLDTTSDDGQETVAKLLPGDDLNCKFVIQSAQTDDESSSVGDVYVRLRVYAICDGNYFPSSFSFTFTDRAKWYNGVDGYWYYKGVLTTGETIDAVKTLHFNENIGNEFAGKTVSVMFSAEALQATGGNGANTTDSINEMWPTAPYEWYRNLV